MMYLIMKTMYIHISYTHIIHLKIILCSLLLFMISCCGRMHEMDGIKIYAADSSSWSLRPPIYLAKHQGEYITIGTIRKQNSDFLIGITIRELNAVSLNTRSIAEREAARCFHEDRKSLSRDTAYIVGEDGKISIYDKKEKKKWYLLAIWKDDTIILVWNRETGGENHRFRSKSHIYVYKKIRLKGDHFEEL